MSDQIKPLSEAEAKEFEGRRESAAVVQHRCMGCGAWYETAKRDTAFQEAFNCDCGNTLRFTVPAMDGVRPLTNEERLDLLGGRLDSGMTASEAIFRAAKWWDKTGRTMIVDQPAMRKFASHDPDDPRFLPSGILNGHTWDMLGRREKIMITKIYHHFFVRKPDLIGGADDPFKPQDRKEIN